MNIPTSHQGRAGEKVSSYRRTGAVWQYGLHATTHDIAALAGKNIAAIATISAQRGFIPRLRPVVADFLGEKISPPC